MRGGQLADPLHDLGQRDAGRVVDVGRDLNPGLAQVDRDRTHPRRPAARLAQRGGDLARPLEADPVDDHVERRQRGASGDQRRSRGRMWLHRAEVGLELARRHPLAQGLQATAAEVGALATLIARRQFAVEEDRDPGFGDRAGDPASLLGRDLAVLWTDPYDRTDVERPDPRDGRRRGGACRSRPCRPRRREPAPRPAASARPPGSAPSGCGPGRSACRAIRPPPRTGRRRARSGLGRDPRRDSARRAASAFAQAIRA